MNQNKLIGLTILGTTVFLLISFILIPNFLDNKINEGKDLGKIELINEIVNGQIPSNYIYCPELNIGEIRLEYATLLNKEFNLTDEQIINEVNNIIKPLVEQCEEKDLYIQYIPITNITQSGYNQAIQEIQQNYNCELK